MGYFIVELDTDVKQNAQIDFGDNFANFKNQAETGSRTTVYRGFLTQYLESSEEVTWCLPYYEECDPDKQRDFLFIVAVSCGISWGIVLLGTCCYQICSRGRKRRIFMEKVKEMK